MKHGFDTDARRSRDAKATAVDPSQTGSAVHVSDVYPDPRFALPAIVLGTLTVVLLIHLGVQWYWIALVVLGAFSAAGALQWKVFSEVDQKVVREEARLFGGKLLKKRFTPRTDFEAVVFRHHKVADEEDWTVGSRHCSGRKIWVRRYLWNDPKHSAPGHAADGFALMLSRETGLAIEDYHPQKPGQWLRSAFAR